MADRFSYALRFAAWSTIVIFLGGLAFGVEGGTDPLELPELVVKGLDKAQLEASRRGAIPVESGTVKLSAPRVTLPAGFDSAAGLSDSPKVQAPGCAYSSPMGSAIARLAHNPESYYKSGLAAYLDERLEDAAFYFEQTREAKDPGEFEGDASFWLGEVRRRQGKIDLALFAYERTTGSYLFEAQYRFAWLADQSGRTVDAMSMWKTIAHTQDHPYLAEALYGLALRDYSARELDMAGEKLARGIEAGEPGSDVWVATAYLLSLANRELGKLDEAEANLTRLLLTRPDHELAPYAKLVVGWVQLERGNMGSAARRFEKAAQGEEDAIKVSARYGLVRVAAAGKDAATVVKAIEFLSTVATDGPWLGWAYGDLGAVLFGAAEYEKAYKAYSEAVESWEGEGVEPLRYMMGECLYKLGQYGDAEKVYSLVGAKSSVAPEAWLRAGVCALLSGSPKKALGHFDAVLDGFPGFAKADKAWAWKGEAHLRLGMTDEAKRAFEVIGRDSTAYSQGLYSRAWIAFEAGRWDEAAELFAAHLNMYRDDPNRDEAMLALSRAHFNRRSVTAALATADELVRTASTKQMIEQARYHLGWMKERGAKREEGRIELEALVADSPKGEWADDAHYALGWSYFGGEEYGKALAHFNAVTKLGRGGERERVAMKKSADSLYNLGKYEEAIKGYQALGDTIEGNYGVALTLGRLAAVERLASVVESFEAKFPQDERGVDLRLLLAQELERKGDFAGSAISLEIAAANQEGAGKNQTRLLLGRSYLLSGKAREAEALFTELAALDEGTGLTALNELASLQAGQGRYAEAMNRMDELAGREAEEGGIVEALKRGAGYGRKAGMFEEADGMLAKAADIVGEKSPDYRGLLNDRGELLIEAGALEQAMDPLEKAVALGEGEGILRSRYLYSKALDSMGRTEEALETYLRIGYLHPFSDERVCEVTMRAAELLAESDRTKQARSLYEKVKASGTDWWRKEAGEKLKTLLPGE